MIQRKYRYLKFNRTYTGGSKKREIEIFDRVQHSGPECDWIEYRRILFPYLDDVLHINFSRSIIAKNVGNILLAIAFPFAFFQLHALSVFIVTLAIISRLLHIFYEKKITETLSTYNLSIRVVKNEIKIVTGLDV